MTISREAEAKLSAPVGLPLPDLQTVTGVEACVDLGEVTLDATYFDTVDLRLVRNRMTLRHRSAATGSPGTEHSWTLKLPSGADGVAMVRTELTWAGEPDSIPQEALALVRATLRGAALVPVARLTTHRHRSRLEGRAGRGLGEIDDDLVIVVEGPRRGETFREIEVEMAPEAPEGLLEEVVQELERAGASRDAQVPKLARALGDLATQGPDAVVPELDKHSTIGEVVSASIGAAVTTLLAQDPGIRLGDDIEHVHKARVATRRLRSHLRLLRPVLNDLWVGDIQEELRWAAAALGEVRDADVLLEKLRSEVEGLDASDAARAQGLTERLAAERAEANARLLAVLDSDRYLDLLGALEAAAIEPPLSALPAHQGPGEQRANQVLPALAARPWKRLRREVRSLPDDPPDDALHEVRKRAKQLRYACELAEPVTGGIAGRLGGRAEQLQEVLGNLHDAVVRAGWIRSHAAQLAAPQALVAGELLCQALDERMELRQAWQPVWQRVNKQKLRDWIKRPRARQIPA